MLYFYFRAAENAISGWGEVQGEVRCAERAEGKAQGDGRSCDA